MMRFLLPAALAAALMSGSVSAQTADDPCASYVSGAQFTNAADPAIFAEAWSQSLTRLALALPVLSPSEERWLHDELTAGVERWVRSLRSREYAQQQARQHALTLAALMRNITTERDRAVLIRKWLAFVDEVFAVDASRHLAELVDQHVIKPDVLPPAWVELDLGGEKVYSTQDWIDRGQQALVQFIVRCTLPALGVGSRADAEPAPALAPAR